MAIEKLISEKRFKETDSASDGAGNYDSGDVIYCTSTNEFKRSDGSSWASLDLSGASIAVDTAAVDAAGAIMVGDVDGKGEIIVGDGSGDPTILGVGSNGQVLTADSNEGSGVKWADAPGSGPLSDLNDVKAYGDQDIGKLLEYKDPEIIIDWTGTTEIVVTMEKTGKRGANGNAVGITFTNHADHSAGVASYDSTGDGALEVKYQDGVTQASAIQTAISNVADFQAEIRGTSTHTASHSDISGGASTFFGGWMSVDKLEGHYVSENLDITSADKAIEGHLITAGSGVFIVDNTGAGSNAVTLHVGNANRSERSGIFQILEKNGVPFDVTTSNGNVLKRDGSTHAAGTQEVGSDQVMELWYTGTDWRFMIKSM